MTKAQFYDVLCNPDGYIGCDIVVCSGAPCVRHGKIFYTTLDTFVYEYTALHPTPYTIHHTPYTNPPHLVPRRD